MANYRYVYGMTCTLTIMMIMILPVSANEDAQRDSLLLLLETSVEDTARVDILNALSYHVFRTDPTSAVFYGNLARNLSTELHYTRGLACALKNIGLGQYMQGNYLDVLDVWIRSLGQFRVAGDTVGISNLLNNLGAVYFNQGDDAKALQFYLESLRIAEKVGDSLRIATAMLNIGTVYLNKKNTHDKALGYYQKASALSEAIGNQEAIGTSAVNIGEIYLSQGKVQQALQSFERALTAFRKAGGNVPYALNNLGKAYAQAGAYDKAITAQQEAFNVAEQKQDKLEMARALVGLGQSYRAEGRLQDALDAFAGAGDIADRIGSQYELKDAFQGMALTYAGMSDYQSAFKYQEQFIAIKDTLYSIETDDKLKGLQFTYEIAKKEDEISLLEKDRALQEMKIERQQFARNALIGGLGMLLAIAFVIFRNYRIKVKTNRILDKQKMEIENLLLNILPAQVAQELQRDGYATPREYTSVTVLFTDFKGFTKIAEGMSPHALIAELNSYFNAFDNIIEKYMLEKIKTIGDAYMCAGGVPVPSKTHALNAIRAGIEMQKHMDKKNLQRVSKGLDPWELRIGLHTGPVVAGVVGRKKYAYDIWGDTVNIASRMESNSEPGKVNISQATYELVRQHFECQHRGKISAKNKGQIDMYFVLREIDASVKEEIVGI